MTSGFNNWLNDATRSLKADPKKTGSLGVLVLVLLVLLAKQFMGGAPSRPAAASASESTSTGQMSLTTVTASDARQQAVVTAIQKWSEPVVPPISRNLFDVRIDYFPMDGSGTSKTVGNDEGFWSTLEKSLTQRTDERHRHENLVASFTADAEKLKLQSTLPGPQPRAMIDGKLVGEGSVVASFRIVKIDARKVIVEREGIRLEIQMK